MHNARHPALLSLALASAGLALSACGTTATRQVTVAPEAAAPVAPLAPIAPVASVASVASVAPVAAVTPVAPVAPVKSVAPVAPVAHVAAVDPVAKAAVAASSAALAEPIAVGETVPALVLRTVADEPFDLRASLARQPAVLIFFRGGWCPYCVRHLSDLRTIEPDLIALGFQVLAISPEQPSVLAATAKINGVGYRLLSDSNMSGARALGLSFRVDDATIEKYRGYGIDLDAASGHDHHELPVPAALVVGRDGVVRFIHVNPDYRARIEPAALLEAARALAP